MIVSVSITGVCLVIVAAIIIVLFGRRNSASKSVEKEMDVVEVLPKDSIPRVSEVEIIKKVGSGNFGNIRLLIFRKFRGSL